MSNSTPENAMQLYHAQETLGEMVKAGEIDKYLYSYRVGNDEVSDLNIDGVNRLARACGVSVLDVEIIDETETEITVKAIAVNPDGLQHIGLVRESKVNRGGYPNNYALQTATAKAQRNAKKGLLPMAEVRDAVKQAGRVMVEDDPTHSH